MGTMTESDPSSAPDDEVRFATVSRRALLVRGGSAATVAAILGLSACGRHDDRAVLGDARSEPALVAGDRSTSSTVPTDATDSTAGATTTTEPATLGGEVTIDFTYEASGGRAHNPYVAVWVEDEDGDLVDTIALWFQGGQGVRWLDELRRWYLVDGSEASIVAISGATRTPGDHSVVWDLTDLDGGPIGPGRYYLCIEAAREHGPYSLIRAPLDLDGAGTTATLIPDGELTRATVDHAP